MLELLTQLLSLIQDILITPAIWLFPIKWVVVRPGESAIRYTCGKPGPEMVTGVRFGTSTQTIIKRHVQTRIAPTDPVTVLTKDGVPLRADTVITYSIPDLAAFFAGAEDPEDHLAAVAEAACRSTMSSHTFMEIVSNSSILETEVRKQVAEAVSGCGIKVRKTRFQNIEQLADFVRMAGVLVPVIDLKPVSQ